jgi:hypothetical protein
MGLSAFMKGGMSNGSGSQNYHRFGQIRMSSRNYPLLPLGILACVVFSFL